MKRFDLSTIANVITVVNTVIDAIVFLADTLTNLLLGR